MKKINIEIGKFLISHCSNVNEKEKYRNTMHHYTPNNKSKEIVEHFIPRCTKITTFRRESQLHK